MGSQIYKKYNWQCASAKLVYVQLVQRGTAWGQERIMSLRVAGEKLITLADFNLAVSTETTELPNLIPRQIFRLYDSF